MSISILDADNRVIRQWPAQDVKLSGTADVRLDSTSSRRHSGFRHRFRQRETQTRCAHPRLQPSNR
ncbi:MAG: hypothetical protein MZV70_48550 [Desulfobacterales bacterium]|nr:hypothetical protein [Desulfobacterales bacterium]